MLNEQLFLVRQNQSAEVDDLEISQGDHSDHEIVIVETVMGIDHLVVISDHTEDRHEVKIDIQPINKHSFGSFAFSEREKKFQHFTN